MSPRPTAARRHLPNSPFNRAPVEAPPPIRYQVDDRVNHDRHGMGRVVSITDDASSVVVDFRAGNVLRVTLPSTKLIKL